MKKPLFLLTVLFASMTANAAFKIAIPLEANAGGSLPANSIAFVGKNDAGSNPSNPSNPETPVTPENPSENPDGSETPVEKTGAELCDDRVQPTINFLAMNYPESSYKSHEFSDLYVAMIDPVHRDGCKVFVSVPKSKTYSCLKNNDYAESLASDLRKSGYDGVYIESFGSCQ
ncbi:hypothetical protein [Pseudomonas putida]|uniref:hypothetical protein n=1 Tax=Pseudomonas putida TaxID=303 RepID=UPI001E3A1018|nr:hypothetical protein [Pseudomonas putida]MCE0958037.1 hypothetical protein [Pseudomonas putida]